MLRARNACLAATLALLLGACTKDQTSFPSLARRPAERITTSPPAPPPPPPPAAPDPALLERIEVLIGSARSADARFRAGEARARSAVSAAAGAAIASEAWSLATIALSELEASRSQAMIALAEIDTLYARAVIDGTDSQALEKARATVLELVGEEDKVLAELSSRIAS